MSTATTSTETLREIGQRLVAEHGGKARITALPGTDRWEVASVRDRGEDGLLLLGSQIVHGDGTDAMLAPGTRVRHVRHPDLTGVIDNIERKVDGTPSSIPYKVRWDNDSLACDRLGWFYIYATDHGIEATA